MGSFDFFADRDAIYARKDLSPLEKHLAVVILSFRNADTDSAIRRLSPTSLKKTDQRWRTLLIVRACRKELFKTT